MGLQKRCLVCGTDTLKKVAEALRPGDGRNRGRRHQSVRIDLFCKLLEHGCDLVQSAAAMPVADKIHCGPFDGRNQDRPARGVEVLDRHLDDAPPGDKRHPDGSAGDRPSVPGKGNLEFLRAVMRCAVILGGGEERSIVRALPMLHERRDELIGR